MFDSLEVLQKIIEWEGDCSKGADPTVCKYCPLGNKKIQDKKLNCLDYLGLHNDALEGHNDIVASKTKQAAEEELFNLKMDILLAD